MKKSYGIFKAFFLLFIFNVTYSHSSSLARYLTQKNTPEKTCTNDDNDQEATQSNDSPKMRPNITISPTITIIIVIQEKAKR
jgi:hypothetical protein